MRTRPSGSRTSTLTARFGATGEPLADGAPSGPGPVRSRDRKYTYRVEFLSFWQEYFRLCAFRPMFMRPRPHSENNPNFRLRPATRAWRIPLPPLRPNPGQSACPDGEPKSIQSVSRRLCASAVSSRFLRVSASGSGASKGSLLVPVTRPSGQFPHFLATMRPRT
jgi:hypothetical protein